MPTTGARRQRVRETRCLAHRRWHLPPVCVFSNDRTQRLFTLSNDCLAAFRAGNELEPTSFQPCTFIRFAQDGVPASAFPIDRLGGYSFFISPTDSLSNIGLRFVATVFEDALKYPLPRYTLGEKWDMYHLISGLVSSVLVAAGPTWPLHIVITQPSDLARISRLQMQGSTTNTWIVPINTDTHWAF